MKSVAFYKRSKKWKFYISFSQWSLLA
ncbi:MAG: hypothetical protein HN392_04860 [Anaerolineae bacterium]|nr:hypothetical protein [Anaerolineae bacterium]MBT7074270.1 hypothetical protein [Anaerolineae bacterium]MBT7783472.1 hypothetical protein [Anaerolineae bacterium]